MTFRHSKRKSTHKIKYDEKQKIEPPPTVASPAENPELLILQKVYQLCHRRGPAIQEQFSAKEIVLFQWSSPCFIANISIISHHCFPSLYESS